MTEHFPAIATIIVAGVAGLAAVVVARVQKAGTRENLLIGSLHAQLDSMDTRLGTTEKRLDDSLRRERTRDNYIYDLRSHIEAGKPPPPPPWPAGLTNLE